jgi:hypothetical protein
MTALATFARLDVDDLDGTIEALAASGITNLRLRFDHPAGVHFALVGDVVVLAGSADTPEPLGGRADKPRARRATRGAQCHCELSVRPGHQHFEWTSETRQAAGL